MNKAKYGEEYSRRLEGQRKVNLRMLRHAKIVADVVQQNGGTVSFEWPHGNSGYQNEEVQKTLQKIGTKTAVMHGCTVGLISIVNG